MRKVLYRTKKLRLVMEYYPSEYGRWTIYFERRGWFGRWDIDGDLDPTANLLIQTVPREKIEEFSFSDWQR